MGSAREALLERRVAALEECVDALELVLGAVLANQSPEVRAVLEHSARLERARHRLDELDDLEAAAHG